MLQSLASSPIVASSADACSSHHTCGGCLQEGAEACFWCHSTKSCEAISSRPSHPLGGALDVGLDAATCECRPAIYDSCGQCANASHTGCVWLDTPDTKFTVTLGPITQTLDLGKSTNGVCWPGRASARRASRTTAPSSTAASSSASRPCRRRGSGAVPAAVLDDGGAARRARHRPPLLRHAVLPLRAPPPPPRRPAHAAPRRVPARGRARPARRKPMMKAPSAMLSVCRPTRSDSVWRLQTRVLIGAFASPRLTGATLGGGRPSRARSRRPKAPCTTAAALVRLR